MESIQACSDTLAGHRLESLPPAMATLNCLGFIFGGMAMHAERISWLDVESLSEFQLRGL